MVFYTYYRFFYADQEAMHSQKGHSVLAYVTDFYPYFYVACPRGFLGSDVVMLVTHLNVRLTPCLGYAASDVFSEHRERRSRQGGSDGQQEEFDELHG